MDPVSCVSCVSSCYCVNAGETHETFRQESGMRYQSRPHRPDLSSDRASSLPADRRLVPDLDLIVIRTSGRPRRRFLIDRILIALTRTLYYSRAPARRERSSMGPLRARAATQIAPSS